MNTDNSLENISLLNKELQSLSERGWKIYHKEGNSGGGQIKNSEGRTVIYYRNDDGYQTSLINLQMDEPKIYKKWSKNYTDFEIILEIVSQNEEQRILSRKRYLNYQKNNFEVKHEKL